MCFFNLENMSCIDRPKFSHLILSIVMVIVCISLSLGYTHTHTNIYIYIYIYILKLYNLNIISVYKEDITGVEETKPGL